MATKPDGSTTTAMSKLSLQKGAPKPAAKKKAAAVADSWEDEEDSEPEPDEQQPAAVPAGPSVDDEDGSGRPGVVAPPPTPSTPSYYGEDGGPGGAPPGWPSATDGPSRAGGGGRGAASSQERRPEKTDAVARRMIASALGVKAPRATEEQRAYDRALREKERKRRDEEKAAERRRAEEAEKAKAAVWGD